MAAIVWFRRDLRVSDHAALQAAVATGEPVIALYIFDQPRGQNWRIGAASGAWLNRSLAALAKQLSALGCELIIRSGRAARVIASVCGEYDAAATNQSSGERVTAVFWHRLYEPDAVARDTAIKAQLQANGLHAESFAGHMLNEPWTIKTQQREVYRVFTPYWRNAWNSLLLEHHAGLRVPLAAPAAIRGATGVSTLALAALKLTPTRPQNRPWDHAFWHEFCPGEVGAQACISQFQDDALHHYQTGRDRPDRRGTSKLGPHLHFGEVSVNQLLALAIHESSAKLKPHAEFFVRELGWRDFSHQLLFHFPQIDRKNLNKKFDALPWAEVSTPMLKAWQRGRTGIPIIDAGMRELWQTGWMHNRVRMLVASFLCKNLRYHWEHGARWFWNTLLDADLANNTQGWQWSAGTGADAAPYFRIFNPVTQGEKFDPNGDYVRRFVPELKHLSGASIHQPWKLGGVSGYPKPILDLAQTRVDALAAFAKTKLAATADGELGSD